MTVMLARPTVTALVTGLVDYAGLFPPAGLDMVTAVDHYARYRSDSSERMLGRFVVPVNRLDEFRAAAEGHLPTRPDGAPWRLAALLGGDVVTDLAGIARANVAYSRPTTGRLVVDVLEVKATTVAAVDVVARAIPPGFEVYVEVPLSPDPTPLLDALAARRLHAKVRTGGVTADAIPSAGDIATFLVAVARAGVAFKATAGLHHAIRGRYSLTYAADSPTAVMHGFVNVFIAAALAHVGAPVADLIAALEETEPSAFRFAEADVRWRAHSLTVKQLQDTRSRFARSFGSCSFHEPAAEIGAWQ